ncbi:PREDICTED: general transcription factor 3C polypeptide 1-like isoform X1 [Cyprinodon variegatus]|uniref:general transcription factor 3C polypeptide 1-like isoform X1 n=1 Tax=Cyprinodon variegatus TaxID=28743 RepID=UPI000742BD61|nr:PREDICTED: general transcription factor 3C polypeptide 1-like isoform X1 [Cyprinodon variegatus]
MDALSIVADEVALEGLEGITLPSLWIRLEDRKPKFPLKLDDCTKGFIWRSLASNAELSFYELPVERQDVELFDRFINIDPETGFEIKHKFIPEKMNIYPASIIPENKDGIQGSCVFFKERKDVTKHVRCKSLTPLVSIQEAMEKYGRKLVVVASQALRFRTLIGSGTDPDLKLSNESFCLLERIGRGRWQGELQSDLHTTLFKIDPRTMHYFRKSLVKHDLITMQSYIRRLTTGQQQHTILLLLKRFHVNRRSKNDILLEQVSDFLQQLPNQFCPVDYLKKQLNMNEKTLKRVFSCFRFSKIVEFSQHPIEEIDPTAEPVTNKNGTKVLVRCIKLLKPYGNRNTADFDDEDDEDEEYAGGRGGGLPSEGRIMERDILSQAYHIILSSGTKGMSQREVGLRLNIGKLESRVICRHLSKADVIKSFMEDEGRQRTYKFISHKFVSGSNQLQLFAKEQERSKLLCSSSPNVLDTEPDSSKTSSTSKVPKTKGCKTPKGRNSKKAGEGKKKDAEEEQQLVCENLTEDSVDENPDGKSNGVNAKSRKKKSVKENNMTAKQTQPDTPTTQSTQAECETPSSSGSMEETTLNSADIPTAVEEEEQPNLSPASSLPQSEAALSSDNSSSTKIIEVESDFQPQRSHETYRLLKRKNLIVEAIRNLKIVEGFFPLQKIISEAEKQEGVNTKCCRKTVLRLVHCLSKEGLLKLYTTTVVQDGVTKKVNIVVHPSIQPNDEKVIQLIDEVRFKISSSYAAGRLQVAEEKQLKSTSKEQRSDALHQSLEDEEDKNFKPTTVPGLGKTFGFQPKMIRLRVIHSFLWYLLYDHPLRDKASKPDLSSQTPVEPVESNPDTKLPESKAKLDVKESETSNSSLMGEGSGDEDSQQSDKSKPDQCDSDLKVYVDEHSWRRFVPPVYVQKGFSTGWAMLRNILLCLPLSILVQIVQFNYKVDELEDYLSDPVKQHYLVRALPQRMKRQLLYKRRYIHVFYVNLQKLTYMGLLQFGVVERFKDKDQVFIYVKRNATIVDTTTSEPHYWLVQEPPDKPFERRHYVFNTAQDVESFWFDLMCVCLNTPLGVVRSKRNGAADESTPPFVHDHSVIVGMGYLLKGSYEVCDDGSIPGDGRGAGGRDSELFSHLKRNWLWTSHLLNTNTKLSGSQAPDPQPRLKSLLSRSALRMALQAGNAIAPSYLTNKRPLIKENIKVGIEPAFRNQQVVGGKGQKRNKKKKEAVKVQRKSKKEPRKRTLAHDATDHQALKRMTRNRVYWSVQEDSIMMLCSVASDLLNSKLKRPFVPHCVVRDILHAEFDKSKDKTSVSVARRSTYILKNPQTVLNYRICLAEVHQDKALMTLLEENKPADPNDPEACAKAFSEYMRLLRQKFKTIMDDRAPMIPDSQEQIFSQYKVSAIDDGKHVIYKDTISCKEDIYAVVLYNLIQSSLVMTNGQMKSSRSFQTFQTYNKYDQELLCRVFVQCRKRGLYNRRRITPSLEPKRNRCLPILPMSFQMSQSYYRRFSWRIPHSLCTDSFCFLRNLITNGTGDNRPATAFYHETEIRSQASEETCERKTARKGKPTSTMDSHKQTAGEESTTEVNNSQSIMQGEEKPVESDGKIESTDEKITLDEQKIPECSAQSGADDGSSSREQTDDHVPEEPEEAPAAKPGAAPQDPPDLSDMLKFSLNNPGGACVVSLSLMTLGLLSVHVSIPKQIVVVDSSLVDNEVVKR